MCAILGFLSSIDVPLGPLMNLIDNQKSRGPDHTGYLFDLKHGFFFAHNRLSIIDLNSRSNQPFCSVDGRYILTFNGEIYNHRSLRDRLSRLGVQFLTNSDTESLLQSLIIFGVPETLSLLNGMFAFSFFDKLTRKLVLARDFVGEKPLYYSISNGSILFSSLLSPHLAFSSSNNSLSSIAVSDYFSYGYIHEPNTISSNVCKLTKGSFLTYDLDTSCYSIDTFSPESHIVCPPNHHTCLEDLLSSSILHRLQSDVPVGVFLSSGLDSSVIAALATSLSSAPINTFTISFDDSRLDESITSSLISDYLGTNHHVFRCSESEILSLIPSLPDFFDEPFADSSALPTLLLSRYASEHVKVCLTGDGADELFCGYSRYNYYKTIKKFFYPRHLPFLSQLYNSLPALFPNSIPSPFNEIQLVKNILRLIGILKYSSSTSLYDALINLNSSRNSILTQAFSSVPSREIFNSSSYELGIHLKEICNYDFNFYLPSDILVKADRSSMSFGLETRCPYLDPSVVSFAKLLPSVYFSESGIRKPLLRDILYNYLPAELLPRSKKGFTSPLASWLSGPLDHILLPFLDYSFIKDQGIFDFNNLNLLYRRFHSGEKYLSAHLWQYLVFQLYLQKYSLSL